LLLAAAVAQTRAAVAQAATEVLCLENHLAQIHQQKTL